MILYKMLRYYTTWYKHKIVPYDTIWQCFKWYNFVSYDIILFHSHFSIARWLPLVYQWYWCLQIVVTIGRFVLQAHHICSSIGSTGFSIISAILKMAASSVHANFSDISCTVFSLQIKFKEKNFIFLVRGKDVKYVSDRKYQIKLKSRDVLSHLTPPILCYFGCSMSHIVIH